MPKNTIHVEFCNWEHYSLLDSGNGQKLERFGEVILIRSEPKAWWEKSLPPQEWNKAHAVHDEAQKKWIFKKKIPLEWELRLDDLRLSAKFFNTSKHLGIFPEQIGHWRWIQKRGIQNMSVLSLFGYTGIASLVAAKNGAHVTHVDASKPALAWARANQELSGLTDKPIRWILEDAQKFVEREIRRNKTYDAIILDPPSFGRGPAKEAWKIEANLVPLLQNCRRILKAKPAFVILTLYALEASSLMIQNVLQDMMQGIDGTIEIGELAHLQSNKKTVLPLSLYGRWYS